MHWARIDSSDFGGQVPTPRSGHTTVSIRRQLPSRRVFSSTAPEAAAVGLPLVSGMELQPHSRCVVSLSAALALPPPATRSFQFFPQTFHGMSRIYGEHSQHISLSCISLSALEGLVWWLNCYPHLIH